MSARRLFVATIAIAWLLPMAITGAIALHAAFEHHGDEHHGEKSHRIDLLEVAEHGHARAAGDAPHQHSTVVASADAVARRALDSTSIPSRTAENAAGRSAEPDAALECHTRKLLEPPKASGPPLLARLSTLRI